MTGKLMKYEARCVGRQMGIVWAALPVIAVVASFAAWVCRRSSAAEIVAKSSILKIVFNNLPLLVYIGLFIALIVMTLFIAIMRFYKGLLKEEGYLMHTLPVKPWQLILSKGAVTSGMILISIFVAAISIVLLNLVGNVSGIVDCFRALGQVMQKYPKAWLYAFEGIVLAVLAILAEVSKVYAALSIGQLSGKHRIVWSVAAYIGIGIAFMMIVTFFINHLMSPILLNMYGNEWDILAQSNALQWIFGISLVYFAAQVGIYWLVSERIISKRLNLE